MVYVSKNCACYETKALEGDHSVFQDKGLVQEHPGGLTDCSDSR
jgi:hypothetical protein